MPLYLGNDEISKVSIAFDGSGSTSGVDTSDATLTSGNQMLKGITSYSKGKKYTGTIQTVEAPTPNISISDNGLITADISNPKGYQSSDTTKSATKQLTIQEAKTITPSSTSQTAVSKGVYTTGIVSVDAVPTETKTITTNGTYSPTSGKYFSGVTVNVPSSGIDTSDATASADDIASGKTAYVNGEKITGTVNTVSNNSIGKYLSFYTTSFDSANNSILVEGKMSGDALYRDGSYSQMYIPGNNFGFADKENVLSGKTFTSLYGLKITGTMPSKEAATITPTTTDQKISAGQYLSGTQTIKGDVNLVSENIISGKSIFGVSGNVVIQKYYTGTTEPSSSLGNDGDIYLKA